MLTKHGAFLPFGSSMTGSGDVTVDSTFMEKEHPPSQEVIDALTQLYRQKAEADEIRAAAICFDVSIVPPGKTAKADAVAIGLEHRSGEAVNVFLPYQKRWFGRIRYSELFATPRDGQFFSPARRRSSEPSHEGL
jgi:hypothetical protein